MIGITFISINFELYKNGINKVDDFKTVEINVADIKSNDNKS